MGAVTRGVLDTSILIATDLDGSDILPDEACISVVSLAELHYGVLVAKDDVKRRHRLRRLGTIEAKFPVVTIDVDIARLYAAVAHTVLNAGRSPRARTMDLWIAATAYARNLPLYTRNRDDFNGLETMIELRVV